MNQDQQKNAPDPPAGMKRSQERSHKPAPSQDKPPLLPLEQEQSRLRLFAHTLESISEMVTITDMEDRFIYVNSAFLKRYGYPLDEVIGKHVSLLWSPDNPPSLRQTILEQSRRGGIKTEILNLDRDGNEFTIELSTSPLKNEKGVIEGLIGISIDVSERKWIEKRDRVFLNLGRSLSQTRSPKQAAAIILNAAFDIIGGDAGFFCWIVNKEQKTIIEPLLAIDIIDGRQVECTETLDMSSPGPMMRKMIAGGKQLILRDKKFPYEDANQFGDRARRSASLLFVPVYQEGKSIAALTIQSYTPQAYTEESLEAFQSLADHCGGALERLRVEEQRRNLEEQIQYAQKLESLGVLAGGIAHDFNNLLMSILGNADLALMDTPESSPARSCLEEIEKASQRAADLCNQMLAYSGKGRFVVQKVNLVEILEEMAHLLKVSISKKAVLEYHYIENLPAIEVDVTQLRQIIMNLIINASEALGEETGRISLDVGVMDCDRAYLEETYLDDHLAPGKYVYLQVADTGCGMDEETLENLFDPFFTTKFTGRGLGLAAVLGIVRGHRGAIEVESTKGEGATFRVLFPAIKDTAPSVNKPQAAHNSWQGQGVILLVDDEKQVLSVGKKMLERFGFEVLTATDGQEAIKVFQENRHSIVCTLLDLTMPEMDGQETFRKIRRIQADARIILCSGYNEQEVAEKFAGEKLSGFLQKPYHITSLQKKIQEVLKES
jgi:PAS domain S-box-containing protein